MLLRQYAIGWWFVIPSLLTNVSALPGEMWTPEIVSFQSCWVFAETFHAVRSKWNFSGRLVFKRYFWGSNFIEIGQAVRKCVGSKFAVSHRYGQINGKGQISSPTAPKPLNRFWLNLNRTSELSPEGQPQCKISFRFDDVGGLGEYQAWPKRQFLEFVFPQVVQRH